MKHTIAQTILDLSAEHDELEVRIQKMKLLHPHYDKTVYCFMLGKQAGLGLALAYLNTFHRPDEREFSCIANHAKKAGGGEQEQ